MSSAALPCAGTAEMHFCVGTVDPCRLYEKTL